MRLWHFVCVIPITTSRGSDLSCFGNGPYLANDAYIPHCSSWMGELDVARTRCNADSRCSVLHDYNCDGRNWRWCSSDLAALEAYPGTDAEQATHGDACSEVNVICTTSTVTSTTVSTRTATTTTILTTVTNLVPCFVDGPTVTNAFETLSCSTEYLPLDEAVVQCGAQPNCTFIHDWICDQRGWRQCSGDITMIDGGGACTKIPGWCEETYTSVTVTETSQTATETSTGTSVTTTGTITATTSITATSATATGTTVTSITSTTSSTSTTSETFTTATATKTTLTTTSGTTTSTGTFASRSSIRMAPGQSLQVAADPIAGGSEGTVSFWVKLISLGTVATHLISAGAQSTDSYGHASFIEEGVLKIYSNAASGQGKRLEVDPNPIPMNVWTHVCYTFDPAAFIKLYINGQALGATAASVTWGTAAKLTPGLTINMPNSVPNNVPDGLATQISGDVMYDEVTLWPRALNIIEVLQVFRYVVLMSSRAWWRFEDSLADSSGNALSLAGWNAGVGSFSADTSQETPAGTTVDEDLLASSTQESSTSTTPTQTTTTTSTSTTTSTATTATATTLASRSSIRMAPGQSLQVAADPIPAGGEGTVSFWVKLVSLGTVATHLISAGAQSTDSYGHASFIEDGVLKIYSNTASGQGKKLEVDPNPIPMNAWTHVCYTFSPAVFIKLYVNGQALDGTATSATWGSSAKLTPGLTINIPNNVPSSVADDLARQISGDVMYDEVALWPRVLDIVEVLQVFRYVTLTSSRAWWRFEGSLADSSGNALGLAGWNAGAGTFSADTSQEEPTETTVTEGPLASSTEATAAPTTPPSTSSTASTPATTQTTLSPASEATSAPANWILSTKSIYLTSGQSLQLAVDPIPAGGEGTVCFWVKLVSLGTVATHLVSAGAQSRESYGHAALIERGVLKVFANTASGQGRRLEIDPSPIPMNAWTHVCYSFDPGAFIYLYINGQALADTATADTWGAAAKLTPGLAINLPNNIPQGWNLNDPPARQISGDVMYDEVLLWPRVLDVVEVLHVFHFVDPGSSSAWWRFEDGLVDSSGQAQELAGWAAGAGVLTAEVPEGATSTTTTAGPRWAPGPRVANDIFVAHCSGWDDDRSKVEARCEAGPSCTFLHDYGCDGNGWRYCDITMEEALAQSTSDQSACTIVYAPGTSATATTLTNTDTMTSTTDTETMTTETSVTSVTSVTTVTSVTATDTETNTTLTTTTTATSVTTVGPTDTATTATSTATVTSCYRPDLRVWNEAYLANCRPWQGPLEEAEARCDADEECTFLHDWQCDDREWRVCFGNLQEIHDNSGDLNACTKVCERRPEPIEAVTVSGSFDMTTSNAEEFTQDAVVVSAMASAMSEMTGEVVEIFIFILDARRLDLQEAARRAQEAQTVRTEYKITVVNMSAGTRISETMTDVTPAQLTSRINHHLEAAGGNRTYGFAVTNIAAPTLERITLTTTTDPDATFTSRTTTTTLDIRYVDGPRVGNSAHSAHCSSWVGTFAQAAARCDDEPDCSTLHAVNCSHAEWRYCAAGLEELSAEDNGSDACTKVRVPPEDRIVATGVIRMTASSSEQFVEDAGVDAALRESIALVVNVDPDLVELDTYEVGDLRRRLDLRRGKRRLQGASPVHSQYTIAVAGANTGADTCAAIRSVTPEQLTGLIQRKINDTVQDTTHIVTVASLPECRIEARRATTVTTTSSSRYTVWYSSASSDLSVPFIVAVVLLLLLAAVCILIWCCCWTVGQRKSDVTPLDAAVPAPGKKVFHDEEFTGPNGNGHGKVLENGNGFDHRDGPHGPPILKSANWALDETQGPFEEGSTMTPPNPPTTCDTQQSSTTFAVSPNEISMCESPPSIHLGTNPDPPPEVPRCAPEPAHPRGAGQEMLKTVQVGHEIHRACREVHTTTISSGSWPRDAGPREPLPPHDPPPCLPPPMLPPGNPVDLFDRMDQNHDGVVTREEFNSFVKARQSVT